MFNAEEYTRQLTLNAMAPIYTSLIWYKTNGKQSVDDLECKYHNR